jgi:hypothetical protein
MTLFEGGHGGIENQVHWALDIAFRDDEGRIRKDHGPANVGLLRKLALNLLERETSIKSGVALKRLQVGWNEGYLERALKAGTLENLDALRGRAAVAAVGTCP